MQHSFAAGPLESTRHLTMFEFESRSLTTRIESDGDDEHDNSLALHHHMTQSKRAPAPFTAPLWAAAAALSPTRWQPHW